MLVKKKWMVANDFHSMEKYNGSAMATINCLVNNILQMEWYEAE